MTVGGCAGLDHRGWRRSTKPMDLQLCGWNECLVDVAFPLATVHSDLTMFTYLKINFRGGSYSEFHRGVFLSVLVYLHLVDLVTTVSTRSTCWSPRLPRATHSDPTTVYLMAKSLELGGVRVHCPG
ncbi:hypothetical protein RRG08_052342 [Elysia crispata]|uniref:Uncharacterized protein n=1 Tax=Elysia crispata TaxID=231223 RepID=A0AAE1A7J7_9GAST|nr:hypothetical protein RRG08_052342 [Elysia crispata]